jgi:hypothetical protein
MPLRLLTLSRRTRAAEAPQVRKRSAKRARKRK